MSNTPKNCKTCGGLMPRNGESECAMCQVARSAHLLGIGLHRPVSGVIRLGRRTRAVAV